jgi:hypothetical protein
MLANKNGDASFSPELTIRKMGMRENNYESEDSSKQGAGMKRKTRVVRGVAPDRGCGSSLQPAVARQRGSP